MDAEIVVLFLSLGVLLGTARLFGQLAQMLHQPAVLGELLAGVLLGPTLFGAILPEAHSWLFPATGSNAVALHAVTTLSIVLFLLIAGLEVDLSTIWRQGRVAIKVGVLGMLIPAALGFMVAIGLSDRLGRQDDADPLLFALFLSIAFAISALPVIARTLMDLDLYRTDLGMIVISAAILNDLVGWTAFAVIQGMISSASVESVNVPLSIVMTLGFAAAMLTVVRWSIHRILPYLQAYMAWPSGVLGFFMTLAFFGAAFAEWIGLHAIFGSFLVGIAIGDSSHLRERTRVTLEQFIASIFAPLFFASVGLRVNFLTHFDGPLVAVVLVVACLGKLSGATLGAKWGGQPWRQAWAIGFAMNARGAMEIILGLLAVEAGLISDRLFVALVVMAVATSMMSGPAMRSVLHLKQAHQLMRTLTSKAFVAHLRATTSRAAIHELAEAACDAARLSLSNIEQQAWLREDVLPTGIGHGVAVPHARVPGLTEPLVAVGLSPLGIDFDAPDGRPAHVIFFMLTPADQPLLQLELSAEIAQMFRDESLLDQVQGVTSFTEFLAVIKAHS